MNCTVDGAVVPDSQCKLAMPAASETATQSSGCEKIVNGGMDGSQGYFGLVSTTFSGSKMVITGRPGSPGYGSQNVTVQAGKRYNFSVSWTVAGSKSVCTNGSAAPFAAWKIVNGAAVDAYVRSPKTMCGGSSYTDSGSFLANHTGTVQIVLWIESNETVTAMADNLSVTEVP